MGKVLLIVAFIAVYGPAMGAEPQKCQSAMAGSYADFQAEQARFDARRGFLGKMLGIGAAAAVTGGGLYTWLNYEPSPPPRVIFIPDLHFTDNSDAQKLEAYEAAKAHRAMVIFEGGPFVLANLQNEYHTGLENEVLFHLGAMTISTLVHNLRAIDPTEIDNEMFQSYLDFAAYLPIRKLGRQLWPRTRERILHRADASSKKLVTLVEELQAAAMNKTDVNVGISKKFSSEQLRILSQAHLESVIEEVERNPKLYPDTALARQVLAGYGTKMSDIAEALYRIREIYIGAPRDIATGENIANAYAIASREGVDLLVFMGAAHVPPIAAALRDKLDSIPIGVKWNWEYNRYANSPNPEDRQLFEDLNSMPRMTP